jgi:hypothetical protein
VVPDPHRGDRGGSSDRLVVRSAPEPDCLKTQTRRLPAATPRELALSAFQATLERSPNERSCWSHLVLVAVAMPRESAPMGFGAPFS